MGNTLVINTTALHFSYRPGGETLTDINLQVERGSIYGFLGPNGSGKTTTLSLLLGLLKTQRGSIEICGKDIRSSRCGILKKIGAMIEYPSFYSHLTARENLEIYRSIYGAPTERVMEVLKIVELADTGGKTAGSFSLGMKQRLGLALALLPKPEILILDEPANGLDPSGIVALREMMKKLNKEEGMTILVSSHILAEVEKMASHVGIISKGRMLFQGSLLELQQKQSKMIISTSNNEAAVHILKEFGAEIFQDKLSIPINDLKQTAAVNRLLLASNLDVYLLQPKESNLEEVFVNLTSTVL